jgi:hypothetical protein
MQPIGREEESSPGDENWILRAYCLAQCRLIVRLNCSVELFGWIVRVDCSGGLGRSRRSARRSAIDLARVDLEDLLCRRI